MLISEFKARGLRNYQSINISFQKGLNILYGPNGSGKTNIVEAIDYFTIGKSFKAESDLELINFNEEFAKVQIELIKSKKEELEFVISKTSKKILLNGNEIKRLSELPGNLIDVVFVPKDVLLFKTSPLIRRKLIDLTISSIDKKYLNELSTYKTLLKERNAMLKNELFDETYLQIITDKMIDSSFYVFKKRNEFFNKVNSLINETYKKLDDEKMSIKISYDAFINENDYKTFKGKAKKRYEESKESDFKKKSTNEGIHKEDFKTLLNEHEIDLYGSQGQNRIVCLALKLSIYEIIKESVHEDPILILDDVLSELDDNHQENLLKCLENIEQVFITCTELNDRLKKYYTYEVKDNTVIRR